MEEMTEWKKMRSGIVYDWTDPEIDRSLTRSCSVTIGDRTVIAVGSVVTHDIPSDSLAAGNPCRVIRSLT